jgi:hypothetical protein
MRARDQRQVDTRYIDEQRCPDKEDGNPEAPIAMRTLPVGEMVMASLYMRPLVVMRMCTLTHWVRRILDCISIVFGTVFRQPRVRVCLQLQEAQHRSL